MNHSFSYYIRTTKDKVRDFKAFFINAWKFRKFLSSFREWGGGLCLEEFFSDFLYVLHRYYSEGKNVHQIDESRLQIVNELETALDLLQPAFDDYYHLEDEKTFDWDISFMDAVSGRVVFFGENTPTSEDYERTAKLFEKDRDEFFSYIGRNSLKWWD